MKIAIAAVIMPIIKSPRIKRFFWNKKITFLFCRVRLTLLALVLEVLYQEKSNSSIVFYDVSRETLLNDKRRFYHLVTKWYVLAHSQLLSA